MSTFIDNLELSVRAGRLLKNHGVTSREGFLKLDWETFKTWTGAGRRTWREIEDIQKTFDARVQFQTDLSRAYDLLSELNRLVPKIAERGWFITRGTEGRLRLARNIRRSDFEHG